MALLKNIGCLAAAVIIAISTIGTAAAAAAKPDVEVQSLLERIEKRYAGKGFTATFVQETTVSDLRITDVASGQVMMKRPAKMRWEYDRPDRQIIISDGEHLWIHRPAENQVMVGSSPRFFGREQGAVFLSDMRTIRNIFDITRVQNPSPDRRTLRLVPKEPTPGVEEVYLSTTLDSDEIFEIIIRSEDGNETRIEFIDLAFTRELPDRLFTFEIPPGADVLQMEP